MPIELGYDTIAILDMTENTSNIIETVKSSGERDGDTIVDAIPTISPDHYYIDQASPATEYTVLQTDATNLKAWYKFDNSSSLFENSAPSSANPISLTFTSRTSTTNDGVYSTTDSIIGGSFYKSDTAYSRGYSITPSNWLATNFNTSKQATFAFWVKNTESSNAISHIFRQDQSFIIRNYITEFQVYIAPNNFASYDKASSDVLTYNTWVHIAVVINLTSGTNDNDVVKIYRNGVELATTVSNSYSTMIGVGFQYDEDVCVFAGAGGSNDGFKGYLDDFRIYDKVLTADEISLLYNQKVLVNIEPQPIYADTTENLQYLAEQKTGVKGWRLVRFLPPTSSTWYSVNDNSLGTAPAYGTSYDYTNEWSVDYGGTFDEMFFSTKNMIYWLWTPKTSVEGDYANVGRLVYKSSDNSSQHNVAWYNRSGTAPDPFISVLNHSTAVNQCLYAENSFSSAHIQLIPGNEGMCVFVRTSTDTVTVNAEPDYKTLTFTYQLLPYPPATHLKDDTTDPSGEITTYTHNVLGASYGDGDYIITTSSSDSYNWLCADKVFSDKTDTTSLNRVSFEFNQYNNPNDQQTAGYSLGGFYGDWIKIQFPEAKILQKMRIYISTGLNARAPGVFKIFGSNNGSSWTEIYHQSTQLTTSDYSALTGSGVNYPFSSLHEADISYYEFNISNNTNYLHYAMVVNKITGNSVRLDFIYLEFLMMMMVEYELTFDNPTEGDILIVDSIGGVEHTLQTIPQNVNISVGSVSTVNSLTTSGGTYPISSSITGNSILYTSPIVIIRYKSLYNQVPFDAQWTYSATDTSVHHYGNVGIHTTASDTTSLITKGDINITGTYFKNEQIVCDNPWYEMDSKDIYTMKNKVGIGVSEPQYTLHINGTAYANNGGVSGNGSTNWSTPSDRRIKENIVEASNEMCFENIKNINLYKFNYAKKFTKTRTKTQFGFVAQEVQKYYPKAVQEKEIQVKDGLTINNLLTVDVTQLNYTLYGAIKHYVNELDKIKSQLGIVDAVEEEPVADEIIEEEPVTEDTEEPVTNIDLV